MSKDPGECKFGHTCSSPRCCSRACLASRLMLPPLRWVFLWGSGETDKLRSVNRKNLSVFHSRDYEPRGRSPVALLQELQDWRPTVQWPQRQDKLAQRFSSPLPTPPCYPPPCKSSPARTGRLSEDLQPSEVLINNKLLIQDHLPPWWKALRISSQDASTQVLLPPLLLSWLLHNPSC